MTQSLLLSKLSCLPLHSSDDDVVPDGKDAALFLSWNPEGQLEVHSMLPDGITIGEGPYGRCLIATKEFAKGTLIYRGYCMIGTTVHYQQPTIAEEKKNDVPEPTELRSETLDPYDGTHTKTFDSYIVHIYNKSNGELVESVVNDSTHSVFDMANPDDPHRQVYGFDAFMNHSCDPNTICPDLGRESDRMLYNAIAVKDIKEGDEITCDYALFDYECDGHEIPVCGCRAANCRGSMRGFKNLDIDEKIRLLPRCDKEIVDMFFQDNPVFKIMESQLPEGVGLVVKPDGQKYVVATRTFEKDEVIFTNEATILTKEDLESNRFILKLSNTYTIVDLEDHLIHRGDYAEFVGYDIFMDHSCDPNCYQTYHDKTSYTVYARRSILPGEKITCDYNDLDNQAMNIPAVASTEFKCECDAKECRGVIKA